MSSPVGAILNKIFKKDSWKVQLLSNWDSIVGNLKNKMRLEKVENNYLVIGVYEASWLQELYMLSSVLIKTINQSLDKNRITHIKFVHTTVKKNKEKKIKIEKIIDRKPISLNKIEQEALIRIKDPELKSALHGFLSRCHYEKIEK
jgi:hypothetical protein